MNIIAVSPFRSKVPSCPKGDYPVITPEQLFHIVDSLEGKDRYIVASAGYAGLRRSEVAGLQKKDFFKKEMLTSDGYKTYYFLNLQRQVVDGEIIKNINDGEVLKSESSQAIHPLWSHYYKMMTEEWIPRSGSSKWVFVGKVGNKPISIGSWVNKRWPVVKERFDLPKKMRYHDLRATYSSILLAEGATPADVSDLMRHSTVEMTLKHYRHTFPGQLEKNFEIFSKLYFDLNGQQSGQLE
jgi:integrase